LHADRRLVRDWQRFEAEEPNDLWQMDFKGHFATGGAVATPSPCSMTILATTSASGPVGMSGRRRSRELCWRPLTATACPGGC
jgi:hypothetical protein